MAQSILNQAAEKGIGRTTTRNTTANKSERETIFAQTAIPASAPLILGGGGKSAGTALAGAFVALVQKHGADMLANLKACKDLNDEGRQAFIDALDETRAAWNRYWKGEEATPARKVNGVMIEATPGYKRGVKEGSKMDKLAPQFTRSAYIRLSEAKTYMRALLGGFSPTFDNGYHFVIAEARAYLSGKAKGNAEPKRAPTAMEKAQAYITRLGLNKRQMHKLAELIEAAADA